MTSARFGRMVAVVALVASTGCWIIAGLEDRELDETLAGDGGGGDGAPPTDAAGDGRLPDGGIAPRPCVVEDAFDASPRLLSTINSPLREGAATLSPDELTIVFGSEWDYAADAALGTGGALFVASRASRNDPFGPPRRLFGARTGAAQGSPSLTGNLGRLYYTTYPPASATADIALAIATDAGSGQPSFSGGAILDDVSSAFSDDYVNVSLADDEIFVGRQTSAAHVLFRSRMDGKAIVLEPIPLDTRFDAGVELHAPVIAPDQRTLYFAATGTTITKRVHRVRRPAPDQAFDLATVADVAELNAGGQNIPLWVSPDMCRIYVAQNRGPGILEIGVFEKSPR